MQNSAVTTSVVHIDSSQAANDCEDPVIEAVELTYAHTCTQWLP